MKINLSETIKSYDGKDLIGEGKTPIILRDLIVTALNNVTREEILIAEQKAKIYQLSVKLYSNKEVDLTLDDRSFIKERAGKVLLPLAYGRICEILEGENKDIVDKE